MTTPAIIKLPLSTFKNMSMEQTWRLDDCLNQARQAWKFFEWYKNYVATHQLLFNPLPILQLLKTLRWDDQLLFKNEAIVTIPSFLSTPLLMLTLDLKIIPLTWTNYSINLLHHLESLFIYPLIHSQHLLLLHARCVDDTDIPQFSVFGMVWEFSKYLLVSTLNLWGSQISF